MFDDHKTKMIGLPSPVWWRNYDNTLSRFDRILERDGQTDNKWTELLYQFLAATQ